MVLGPYVVNFKRYSDLASQFINFIPVGRSTTILYSPQLHYSTNSLEIFSIFSLNIWILLLLSYVCLVAINSYKHNIQIISKLILDYFGLITFECINEFYYK